MKTIFLAATMAVAAAITFASAYQPASRVSKTPSPVGLQQGRQPGQQFEHRKNDYFHRMGERLEQIGVDISCVGEATNYHDLQACRQMMHRN